MKKLLTIGAVALAASVMGHTAYAADAYIEVDGTLGIDTRYNAKNSTRCEIDYALTDARPSGDTWYLFAGKPTFCAFINNSGVGFGVAKANSTDGHWSTGNAKDISNTPDLRLSAVLDIPNNSCYVIRDVVTNVTVSLKRTADYSDDQTLKLASNAQDTNNRAKMRIYGCRIYEADVLVHDFRPFKKDGIAGLIDIKTGEFVTNGKKYYGITIGGDYDSSESPYVATPSGNNGVYIDTGYQATSNTCLMLDCLVPVPRRGIGVLRWIHKSLERIWYANQRLANRDFRYRLCRYKGCAAHVCAGRRPCLCLCHNGWRNERHKRCCGLHGAQHIGIDNQDRVSAQLFIGHYSVEDLWMQDFRGRSTGAGLRAVCDWPRAGR